VELCIKVAKIVADKAKNQGVALVPPGSDTQGHEVARKLQWQQALRFRLKMMLLMW
jgi:hypothetical protein